VASVWSKSARAGQDKTPLTQADTPNGNILQWTVQHCSPLPFLRFLGSRFKSNGASGLGVPSGKGALGSEATWTTRLGRWKPLLELKGARGDRLFFCVADEKTFCSFIMIFICK